MAKSVDIRNDINHLQAQWDSENHAAQDIASQIRHLNEQEKQHMNHMNDLQARIRAKQTELQVAQNNEQRDQQAAMRQVRAAA